MDLDSEILLKNKRIEELRAELAKVSKALEYLLLARVKRDYGVEIGSVVLHKGSRFKVCNISNHSWGKPWLKVFPQKAGGTWSSRRQNLFSDWEVEA